MAAYRDDRDVRIEQLRLENDALRAAPFTALDWIAVTLCGFGAVTLVGGALVGRVFAAMYTDFGARTALPWLTRIVVLPITGPASALVPVLLLVAALRGSASIARRRALVATAFVYELIAIGVFAYGLYLPIFETAGRIRAS